MIRYRRAAAWLLALCLPHMGSAFAAPPDPADPAFSTADALSTIADTLIDVAQTVPAIRQTDENTLLLSFVGDCSIGDDIRHRGKSASYHNVVESKGAAWPLSLVRGYLSSDDLTVANLEAVLTTRTRNTGGQFNLRGDPAHVSVLTLGGVDVVNTANNHALDFHASGYEDTLSTLDGAGVGHFGSLSPGTSRGFDRLYTVSVKGVKIGFVGFSLPSYKDVALLTARVEALRDEGCDLVVASLHWGRGNAHKPLDSQIQQAKALIDAGADVIYGHHPHVLQPIFFYRGKPVLFSTGNFTFGTAGKLDPDTGVFQLHYALTDNGPALRELSVIPCRTRGAGDFRPCPLTDADGVRALFAKLRFDREIAGMVRLPERFLDTGRVLLSDGAIVE